MYGIDESKPNTSYADGYGRFCAIVATTADDLTDRFTARKLILGEYATRNYRTPERFAIVLVRTTELGTSIYREN